MWFMASLQPSCLMSFNSRFRRRMKNYPTARSLHPLLSLILVIKEKSTKRAGLGRLGLGRKQTANKNGLTVRESPNPAKAQSNISHHQLPARGLGPPPPPATAPHLGTVRCCISSIRRDETRQPGSVRLGTNTSRSQTTPLIQPKRSCIHLGIFWRITMMLLPLKNNRLKQLPMKRKTKKMSKKRLKAIIATVHSCSCMKSIAPIRISSSYRPSPTPSPRCSTARHSGHPRASPPSPPYPPSRPSPPPPRTTPTRRTRS